MLDCVTVTLVNRVPNSVTVSTGVSGGGTWGTISGTITDQSDLVTYVADEIASIPAPSVPTLDSVTDQGSTTTNAISVGGLTASSLVYPSTDGTANQIIATDGSGTLSFVDAPNDAAWGNISGTLSTQTDLQTAFDAKEDVSNKSTTTTLGTSNTLYPTQNAVKTYVDTEVGNVNVGVTELNGLTGDLDLVAGSNVTITPSGSTITIASTGGGGGGTAEAVDLDTVSQTDTTIDFTIDGDAFFYRQSYGNNGTTTPLGRNIFIGKNTGNINVGSTANANYKGSDNIGIGDNNLDQLTDGARNVAIGQGSGGNISSGGSNILLGWGTGGSITTGSENFLLGNFSGNSLSTHKGNVAIGTTALQRGRGFYNIAIGDRALQGSSSPSVGNNVAIGRSSMGSILTGSDSNVGIGSQTLANLGSNADGNIAIGFQAGQNGVGNGAAYNILIGYRVEPPISTGDNQLNIGNLIHGTGLTSNQTVSTGNIGIATTTPTSTMHLKGTAMEQLRIETSGGPTSNADTSGEIGDIAYDANYIYIKTSNGWGRAALDFSF